ncbi:hypothetical protein KIW84_023432 [Lathyrus oleraceus]|uniref:Retrotransposon gag domain-containing protein n=1 Tax=Pisum sativum TaxID=3888 RepID=A0A9D5BB79_PEA|nr:hypothetical protein KIW84_023432 [Pisum sativum]
MPPKMSDRVEALEEKFGALKESLRFRMEEFQKLVMAEFAKFREKPSSEVSPPLSDEVCYEFKMDAKKVELPLFDVDDPVGWVTKAETFLEVQGSSGEVKVRLAKLSMEGATIHWFNLLRETEDNLTRSKLKRSLIERYGGRKSDNPFEELKDLQQTGDVEGTFNPRTCVEAMKIARDVETELRGSLVRRSGGTRQWKGGRESHYGPGGVGENGSGSNLNGGSGLGLQPKLGQYKSNYGSTYTNGGPTKTAQSNINSNPNSSRGMGRPGQNAETRSNLSKNRGIRHLPYSELMDRKAKGLCFRCGERFHPLHQCAEKQFRLVILGDDETINEEGEMLAIELKEEEEEIALECNALGGFWSDKCEGFMKAFYNDEVGRHDDGYQSIDFGRQRSKPLFHRSKS